MFKKSLKAAAVACALAGSSAAFAFPYTLTNSLGSFSNFSGFDWAQNGTAVVGTIDPFNLAGSIGATDTFNLIYWASATDINQAGGGSIIAARNGLGTNYEYTVQATLAETATCTAVTGGVCTTATFAVNSGAFSIWYSTTVNANQVTGAGITDGNLIVQGTISSQAGGGFDVIAGGNANLNGQVTFTNTAFISPAINSTKAATTLQIGANVTNWTPPTGTPTAGGGSAAYQQNPQQGTFALQADANQNFAPEPGSLALMGLAFGALGLARRRNKQA